MIPRTRNSHLSNLIAAYIFIDLTPTKKPFNVLFKAKNGAAIQITFIKEYTSWDGDTNGNTSRNK